MEPKEVPKMVEMAKNCISTIPTRDSSELRENSTDCTKARSELNTGFYCGPVNAPEQMSQPSKPTSTAQAVTVEVTENNKAKETVSAEAKPMKTGPDEAAHKMKTTDQESFDTENSPTFDAGNDQVTVEKSHESLLESAGSMKPPAASSATSLTKPVSVAVIDAKSPMPADTTLKASVDVQPESSTPKPALVLSTSSIIMQTTDDPTAVDDSLQRLRAPLAEKYAPYIHPSDASLKDARDRLNKALEQTRQLRESFTDRVYKKYRVCLRPVPKSIDAIVNPIVADPAAASRKLEEDIHQIKEEKEIEKKEAQKLAALKAPVGPDGAPLVQALASAAETAEQLAFITSGLNLVILPEEDVDENETDLSDYKYRGPFNPETGQRVGGISAAAGAAAEALLDRVRRGAAMRIERQRRRQLRLLAGETPEMDTTSIMFPSSLHLLSTSDHARRIQERTTPSAKEAKGLLSTRVSLPFSSSSGAKSNRASLSSGALLSLNPSSEDLKPDGKPCAATAALISRGVGVTRPIQQRWRHPHPESLGGRCVMLGTATSGKKCYASDPFDSLVGEQTIPEYIARSLPPLPNQKSWTQVTPVKVLDVPLARSDRARTAIQAVLGQFLEPGDPLAVCKKAVIESSNDENDETSTKDAPGVTGVADKMPSVASDNAETSAKDVCKKAALENSFDERNETSTMNASLVTVGTDESGESLSAAADTTDTTDTSQIDAACNVTSSRNKRGKRCATEIDLLHAMQYTPEQEAKQLTEAQVVKATATREVDAEVASEKVTDSLASSSTRQTPEDTDVTTLPIQPMLAFSVMYALGLVKEAGLEKTDLSAEDRLSLINSSVFQDEDESTDMVADDKDKANLKVFLRNISSRKRSFTEIVLSDAMLKVRTSSSVGKASFFGSRDRMEGEDPSGESVAKKPRREQDNEQSCNEIRPATSTTKECPVLSIRGGGEEIVDGSDDGIRTEKEVAKGIRRPHRQNRVDGDGMRTKAERSSLPGSPDLRPSGSTMSPSAHESSLHNQAMLVDVARQQLSLLHPQHLVNGSDVLYAPDFSTRRSSASPALSSIDRNAALRHQYANLHDSSAHALQLAHDTFAMNRLSASHAHQLSGDFSDYFGVQLPTHHSSGYGSHADWSSLSTASAAASGFLPAHSTLASIGLDAHLGLSVGDRARVMFAREQEHNAAVVAHAAAARRHASTVQAAAFISASQGDLYAHSNSASSHFLHVGGHSAPPVDSGLTGAFVGSPGRRTAKSKKLSKKDSETLSSPGGQRKPPPKTSPSRRFLLKGQSGAQGTEGSEDRNVGAEAVVKKNKSEEPRSTKSATNAQGFPEVLVKFTSEKEDSNGALEMERQSDVYSGVGNPTVAASSGEMTGRPPREQKIASKAPTETTISQLGLFSAEEPLSTPLATSEMQFFLPIAPADLSDDVSNLIVTARFHVALVDESSSLEGSTLIDYLLAVGGAVPIPKALISNPLKERLNTPGFKSQSNNAALSVPREVVVATILVWLWAQNKTSFQRAFAKSGRIDVDPECKWLIHTAVDASVRALMLDIADAVAQGGSMASSFGGGRNKCSTSSAKEGGGQVSASESDRQSGSSTSVDIHTASIVSQALMAQFCVDENVDEALPSYSGLAQLLDKARLCALRTKCRERVLVAALISRNATISEQFSHAYVSAMVRAGEALGHEELFEQVQDEDTLTSTMIPYDIFTEESGAWEDPCRAKEEFGANLTGDDLMRRAHARAMIQKSLKKLQDRHNVRGGAPVAGPYADPPPDSNASGAGSAAGVERPQYQRTPSDSLKRKASFSIASQSSFDRSTGVAVATTMALYNPRHYLAPLFWDADNVENTPYGKHMKGFRQSLFSSGRQSFSEGVGDSQSTSKKRLRVSRADSVSISCPPTDEDSLSLPRSTQEVAWVDVAHIFKPVALAGPTTPTARSGDDDEPETSARTIIAPFCRKVERPPAMGDDEGLGEEEDISDEAVLARHRVVLDRMKHKLDKVMEARQQGQQRDRNRSTSET